jgi:hypothetical protein
VSGHKVTPLELEFRRRLGARFSIAEEMIGSTADLHSVPERPAGKPRVQLTILPCAQADYLELAAVAGGFEALNARMLALPLYVFVREPPTPGRSGGVTRRARTPGPAPQARTGCATCSRRC